MQPMKDFLQLLTFTVFLTLPVAGFSAEVKGATIEEKGKESEQSYIDQLKKLVDDLTATSREATEKSKQATEEAKNWVKEDFSKIGDWEYKQIKIPLTEIATMEKTLNELGTNRWDCFWIQKHEGDIHLLFKRPAVSYLHKISKIDFMKLLSIGGGGGEAAE